MLTYNHISNDKFWAKKMEFLQVTGEGNTDEAEDVNDRKCWAISSLKNSVHIESDDCTAGTWISSTVDSKRVIQN